jgi:hypothetical protein
MTVRDRGGGRNIGKTTVPALGDRGSRVQISPLRPFSRSFFKDCAGHYIALPFPASGTDQQQSANSGTKTPEKVPNYRLRNAPRCSCDVRAARQPSKKAETARGRTGEAPRLTTGTTAERQPAPSIFGSAAMKRVVLPPSVSGSRVRPQGTPRSPSVMLGMKRTVVCTRPTGL